MILVDFQRGDFDCAVPDMLHQDMRGAMFNAPPAVKIGQRNCITSFRMLRCLLKGKIIY